MTAPGEGRGRARAAAAGAPLAAVLHGDGMAALAAASRIGAALLVGHARVRRALRRRGERA